MDTRSLAGYHDVIANRTAQIQIRVTPREKQTIRRLAEASGQDLSSYMLSRALPSNRLRFQELLRALAEAEDHRIPLAGLNDLLTSLAPIEFDEVVEELAGLERLSPYLRNYIAAMVEYAAHLKDRRPPAWTVGIQPLKRPRFATDLEGLRTHLLVSAPVAFKRRNIFVDSSIGSRV